MSPIISLPLRRFRSDGKGNVSMIFALSVPVLALGMAVAMDFTNASVARARLNAAADAAALAALTPAMMQQSLTTAQGAATSMFNGRANMLTNVSLNGLPNITVTLSSSNASMRVATVTYSATVTTLFGGVLGFFGALPSGNGMAVGGTSTAQAAGPANVNFYLLLDNSPSMSLPATNAGITQMEALTPQQGSCAFACHQASTNNGDTQGNPCSDGSTPTLSSGGWSNAYCDTSLGIVQIDDFALAKKNNITLRLDELTNGVTTLMQKAYNYQTTINPTAPPTYQFAAYSMDTLWSIGTSNNQLMGLSTNYQSAWTSAASGFGVMQMWANNQTCNSAACDGAGWQGDTGTNFDVAMNSINTTMPNPGNGSNTSGDTPQEVLFFVTDGVEDEQTTSCTQPLIGGNRCQSPINPALCATIKSRGVKIAILYTEYLQVTNNWWYNVTVAPFQPAIATSLQSCASPGLFYDATADTNLGQALGTLFDKFMQQNAALSN